jgi:hypothetical protein
MPMPVSLTVATSWCVVRMQQDVHVELDRPAVRELAGVAEQVEQDLTELLRVGVQDVVRVRADHDEGVAVALDHRLGGRHDLVAEGAELELAACHGDHVVLDVLGVEHVGNERQQVPPAALIRWMSVARAERAGQSLSQSSSRMSE